MTRADLEKKPAEVAAMFDAIAGRYDLMNDILSMGQVRLWRQRVRRILAPLPGERVLDLAAGTGTSSEVFAEAGADCVACDFSLGMLAEGKQRLTAAGGPKGGQATSEGGPRGEASASERSFERPGESSGAPERSGGASPTRPAMGGRPHGVGGLQGGGAPLGGRVAFAAGDAVRLPFRDDSFDAVTISFGLRNVHGTQAALEEMYRVTRPGGRLVVCEFSRITVPPVDMLYRRYLTAVLPAIARRVARNPVAYDYLAESISDWPAQRELADIIRAAGWSSVKWRNVTLGVVAIHVGRKLRVPA